MGFASAAQRKAVWASKNEKAAGRKVRRKKTKTKKQ